MALSNSFFEQVYLSDFPKWNHGVCPVIKYNAEDLIECQVQKNDKQWKKKQLIFIDQYIICHYNNDNSIKWLSIENSTFKLVQNAKELVPTFIFQQRDNTLKVQGNILSCLKNLKRYIIQNDFKHRYQFQKKLGQGSFADVYQVREKATDNIYAAKMFDKLVLESSESNIKALLKEIQILRILKHDSTINLIECYESQSFIYLIMEQLKGGNLGEYLEKNAPLSEKHTANLIYQLLQSLKYIHGCGIIHRDLKPENIIFREKNNLESLCIADFGLADFYNTEGKYLFTRCGSVGFVAPEILRDKIYDYKVDLFSIGVIMYCAITKKQPFEGNSQQKVQKNYVGEVDFSIINLSENGLEFLKLILKPNPLYRIALPETLTNSWFVSQNILNLKGSVVKKNSIMSSSNLSTSNISESSCSSPRSPSSVKHNNSQSLLIRQSTVKRMSNFKLEKIDSFQSPRRLEQSIKQSKVADKQLVRKSIFKQLEPIKKVTEI